MNKKFLLIASALVILSLISAGIGNTRTVTITPRENAQNTSDEISQPTTALPDTAESITTPSQTDAPTDVASSVTYILNTNTKKFHYPSCESISRIKEKNRRTFDGTREEVIAQGYEPCRRCNP